MSRRSRSIAPGHYPAILNAATTDRVARSALLVVLVLTLAGGVAAYQRAELLTDTVVILNGVGTIDRCLEARVTWNCNSAGLGDVGYFPPFQYAPAWLMKRAGLSK